MSRGWAGEGREDTQYSVNKTPSPKGVWACVSKQDGCKPVHLQWCNAKKIFCGKQRTMYFYLALGKYGSYHRDTSSYVENSILYKVLTNSTFWASKFGYKLGQVSTLQTCKNETCYPYAWLTSDAPTRTRNFSWFTSDTFLRRPISTYQDSYVHSLQVQGGLQAKMVPEGTPYCITWGVPRRVPSSVSLRILRSDTLSWAKASGTLKIKMTARKGHWAISPNSRASHPLCF